VAKSFTDIINDAQEPVYGDPFGTLTPAKNVSKTKVHYEFHCQVFTIHRPKGTCSDCRQKATNSTAPEDEDDIEAEDTTLPGVCTHHEREAYINQINTIHAKNFKLVTRNIDTLKSGAIQVHLEWLEPKKREGV
jgi:hypothetical protein